MQAKAIVEALSVLKGLQVSDTFSAADLRAFGFGSLQETDDGLQPRYVIHIQCPWRLELSGQVFTGFDDYFMPPDESQQRSWTPGSGVPSLQDLKCNEFVYGRVERWTCPRSDAPIVSSAVGDRFGGAMIRFQGGEVLKIFPCGSKGDLWRLFEPGARKPHFVISSKGANLEPY